MRIAICGRMCSGKSTLARCFAKKYGLKIYSFASGLKWFAKELFDMKNKDRKLLQQLAEKTREIDDDIWIKYTLKQIGDQENVVIDDLRFPNELEYLKKNGFTIIRISVTRKQQISRIKKLYKNYDNHIKSIDHHSESHIENLRVDFTLKSDEDIFPKITQIINKIKFNMVKPKFTKGEKVLYKKNGNCLKAEITNVYHDSCGAYYDILLEKNKVFNILEKQTLEEYLLKN